MLVKVPLDDGGEFLVDAGPADEGVVRATRADDAIRSSAETFEGSLTQVRHVAQVIVAKLSGFPAAPDHIRAEFGISLGLESGMVVVKGTADAHFVIELEWSRRPEA